MNGPLSLWHFVAQIGSQLNQGLRPLGLMVCIPSNDGTGCHASSKMPWVAGETLHAGGQPMGLLLVNHQH